MIYPGTTAVVVVEVLATDGLQLLLVYVGHLKVLCNEVLYWFV